MSEAYLLFIPQSLVVDVMADDPATCYVLSCIVLVHLPGAGTMRKA